MTNTDDETEPIMKLFTPSVETPPAPKPDRSQDLNRIRDLAAAERARQGRQSLVRPGIYIP